MKDEVERKRAVDIPVMIYMGISLLILFWGRFFLSCGDEMGFCILTLYLILPAAGFICSLLESRKKAWEKWLLPVLFGIIGWVIPILIFRSSISQLTEEDGIALLYAMAPSFLGMAVGSAAFCWKRRGCKRI